eukprot:COSAG05_NODE_528_length_8915_cov_26.504651_11_plen_60_part_00
MMPVGRAKWQSSSSSSSSRVLVWLVSEDIKAGESSSCVLQSARKASRSSPSRCSNLHKE